MPDTFIQPTAQPSYTGSFSSGTVEHGNKYVQRELTGRFLAEKFQRLSMVCRERLQEKDPATWANFDDKALQKMVENIGLHLIRKMNPLKMSVDFTNDVSLYFVLVFSDWSANLELFLEETEEANSSFLNILEGNQIEKSFEGTLPFVLHQLTLQRP